MALLNKQTVLEHLYKRLIETANNNVGFECDAGIVFEEIATDRIKTWLDEVQTVDAIPISWLEQPVEAEPIRHGEWLSIIEVNEYGEPYQSGVYCSECGETSIYEPNYCPNCGARMDCAERKEE